MHLFDYFVDVINGDIDFSNYDPGNAFLYDVKLKPEVFGQEFIEQYEGSTINIGIYPSKCKIEVWSSINNFSDPILQKNFKVNLI